MKGTMIALRKAQKEIKRQSNVISLLLEAMGEKERNRIRTMAKEEELFFPLQDTFYYGDD